MLANVALQSPYTVPAGYFDTLSERMLELIRSLDTDTAAREIESLSSLISSLKKEMPYSVPLGYFENLADEVLKRIKGEEAKDAAEELEYLSPLLSGASREMPYSIPANYFEGLVETAIWAVKEDELSREEELASLSSLLSSISKEMPYSVPSGYFNEKDENTIAEKQKAKVISLTSRKWFRYAAAAAVTAIFVLSGFLIFRKQQTIDPNSESYAWVKKNLKKVSENDIDEFAELASDGAFASTEPKSDPSAVIEIRDLLKDIPEEAIQKFADEAEPVVISEDDADELFMN